MFKQLENNSKIGALGPSQYFPNGDKQYAYGYLPGIKLSLINYFLLAPILRRYWNFGQNKDYIDGAVMTLRTDVFNRVGGMDEDFFFYSEDAALCEAISRLGFEIIHYPEARIIHYRGASTNIDGINESALSMFVSAKIKLCKKNHSKTLCRFYRSSEIFNNFFVSKMFYIISKFNNSEKSKYKAEYYQKLFKIWMKSIIP
jgi:GT2 family glycosyltransferase